MDFKSQEKDPSELQQLMYFLTAQPGVGRGVKSDCLGNTFITHAVITVLTAVTIVTRAQAAIVTLYSLPRLFSVLVRVACVCHAQ